MTGTDSSMLRRILEKRCDMVAERWYQAIAPTSFAQYPAATVRAHLRSLTHQVMAALVSDPFAPQATRGIGEALVRLHYSAPDALGGTLDVLGGEFLAALPHTHRQVLSPRLAPILAAIATGFVAQSHVTVLREQEEIRAALFDAQQQAEERRQQAEDRLRHEERRRLQEQTTRMAAEAERDHLQQILDVLPEGVLIADATGHFVLSNRAARTIIGRDLVGLALPMTEHASAARQILRHLDATLIAIPDLPLERSILQGHSVQGEQFLVHNAAQDRTVPVLVNTAPLYDRGGRLLSAVAVFQDISTLKDLEQTREIFLSAVSHDLRSPLTGIRGIAQLMQRQFLQDDAPPRAEVIQTLAILLRATDSMTRVLDDLSDLTRLQLGQPLALERAPTDLVALVRAVVEPYQITAPQRIQVHANVPVLMAQVDAARFERVVTNLVTNALKYSPEGGGVTVQIGRDGTTHAVLTVQDWGVGIPAADLPHVFAWFHRGTNVAGRIEGTGVGLASALRILQQHGGTLSVQSQEGVGTTVTLSVPLSNPRT